MLVPAIGTGIDLTQAVEELLTRSFPNAGGADAFRRMVEADVGVDRLGIGATRDGGLDFAYPVVIVSGVKPG